LKAWLFSPVIARIKRSSLSILSISSILGFSDHCFFSYYSDPKLFSKK